jgi:hypothetical protein
MTMDMKQVNSLMSKLLSQNVRLNELPGFAFSRYLRPITKHFLHQRPNVTLQFI